MYSFSSSVHYGIRESFPIHMYMNMFSRIYTICIYIYIYIYIHIHKLVFYKCIAHAQDRHVQLRSPRHQLYEVLGMSADSSPRYHLNEVSGVLPAISGMKSHTYLPTAFSSLLAVCISGLQAHYDDDH